MNVQNSAKQSDTPPGSIMMCHHKEEIWRHCKKLKCRCTCRSIIIFTQTLINRLKETLLLCKCQIMALSDLVTSYYIRSRCKIIMVMTSDLHPRERLLCGPHIMEVMK